MKTMIFTSTAILAWGVSSLAPAVAADEYDTYCEFNDRLVHARHYGFGRDEAEAKQNAWRMCVETLGPGRGNAYYCDATFYYPEPGEWRCESIDNSVSGDYRQEQGQVLPEPGEDHRQDQGQILPEPEPTQPEPPKEDVVPTPPEEITPAPPEEVVVPTPPEETELPPEAPPEKGPDKGKDKGRSP